jgi:hypothetical protein
MKWEVRKEKNVKEKRGKEDKGKTEVERVK